MKLILKMNGVETVIGESPEGMLLAGKLIKDGESSLTVNIEFVKPIGTILSEYSATDEFKRLLEHRWVKNKVSEKDVDEFIDCISSSVYTKLYRRYLITCVCICAELTRQEMKEMFNELHIYDYTDCYRLYKDIIDHPLEYTTAGNINKMLEKNILAIKRKI